MKQTITHSLIVKVCAIVALNLCTVFTFAQVTQISDYVLYAGNGGTGTTNPGAQGYGLILGSGTTINNGAIGAASNIQLPGGATLSCNVFSGGQASFTNGAVVSGRITAANSGALPGIFQDVLM
jgi:hypothetical protein